MNTLIITNSGIKNPQGLYELNMDAFQGKNYLGRLMVNSGAPGHQVFTTVPGEHAGRLEPCPEGEYNLGPLAWAGKKGNYEKLFPAINSPIWVEIYQKRAIGFHLDGNRDRAPGSAGCMVFKSVDDMKTFVNCWNGYGPFKKCFVSWGLDYVVIPDELKDLMKNLKPKPMKKPE